MTEKQIAKRYLISLFALYAAGAVLLTAFIFALAARGKTVIGTHQMVALGMLLPLVPCSSYCGFCTAFLKIGELTKTQMILIVVLFPLLLVLLTIYGFVMLIPSIFRGIKALTNH